MAGSEKAAVAAGTLLPGFEKAPRWWVRPWPAEAGGVPAPALVSRNPSAQIGNALHGCTEVQWDHRYRLREQGSLMRKVSSGTLLPSLGVCNTQSRKCQGNLQSGTLLEGCGVRWREWAGTTGGHARLHGLNCQVREEPWCHAGETVGK